MRTGNRRWLLAAAPIAIALVAHGAGVGGGLVADDIPDLVTHPVVSGEAPLSAVLDYNYMGAPRGEGANTMRPLMTLLFALEWRIGGGDPTLLHSMSILWFALLVALAQRFYGRSLGPPAAALGAAAFASLAIHVDAVGLVANRAEVCSLVFVVLALLVVERGLERDQPPGWHAALAALLYLLALGFKESAFPLPGVVLGWVLATRGGSALRWRKIGRVLMALALVGTGFVIARSLLLPLDIGGAILPADNPLQGASAAERVWMPFVLLGLYLAKSIAPSDLAFDYTYDAIPVAVEPSLAGIAGVLVVLLSAAFLLRVARCSRRGSEPPCWQRRSAGAVLAFFASYSLFSNSVFLIVTLFAERLFLAPSLFLVLALACPLEALGRRSPEVGRALAMVLALFILAQTAASLSRTLELRDEATLFAAQVEKQPASVKGRLWAARTLAARGSYGEAVWQLAVATAGRQRFPGRFLPPAIDDEPLDERLAAIPELIAPGRPPAQAWQAFRGFAGQTLGPGAARAIDDHLARRASEPRGDLTPR